MKSFFKNLFTIIVLCSIVFVIYHTSVLAYTTFKSIHYPNSKQCDKDCYK